MARLVDAGVTLRAQMNRRFPKRDTASDGWIGDANHASRDSDHNPDENGWVHALDIDEDFGAKGDSRVFADQLIKYARDHEDNGRLKYVVYEDRIASGTYDDTYWVWRGSGYGHTEHIHISFTAKAETHGAPFDLEIFNVTQPLWDGHVPSMANVNAAAADDALKNLAAYRVACRLFDLGFYVGRPLPVYEQGYPRKAVASFQKSLGAEGSGNYGPRTEAALFGAA